jgi:hypothetical protein
MAETAGIVEFSMTPAYMDISSGTGRYDIVAWAVFRGVSDLHHFITIELSRVAGLRDTETMTNLELVKFSRRFLTNNE